jgi:hypothetical protein
VERRGDGSNIVFFYGSILAKEEDDEEEENNNFRHLLQWLCCTKWGHVPCFCGFVAKKVTAAMSSPSSMVVV